MPPLTVMFKTVSSRCNLNCAYCYNRGTRGSQTREQQIDLDLLERFMPQYMGAVADVSQASFGWQGGEPTLAGLDFFQSLVALEQKYAAPGTVIGNDIQTNGILLNRGWATFFKQYAFLVGVSLDGPEEMHDRMRRDPGGNGSFKRVMRGIELLEAAEVDLNILCVVGPHNVGHAEQLFSFFAAGRFGYLQFMPAMAFQANAPLSPAAYAITPEDYGRFLVQLFDAWYQHGIPLISIRIFDALLQTYLNLGSHLCHHAASCDSGLIVEADGRVYPCDFYLHQSFCLGNLNIDSLQTILNSDKYRVFKKQKRPYPETCSACRWLVHCNSGCPRNRLGAGGAADFFCESYRALMNHADHKLAELAAKLKRRAAFLEERDQRLQKGIPLPGRNDPCLCGSGIKHKKCCDDPALARSYLFN